MEEALKLPLLEEVLPGGLRFGANYLVEFEPQSLWFEASLTLCAQALRSGVRTDFHTFTHPAEDIRRHLGRLGLDVAGLESDDTFRIVDSHTVQTGLGAAPRIGKGTALDWVDLRSMKMDEWNKGTVNTLREEVPEVDRRRLHIDDNTSVLVQFNDEKSVAEHFRTLTVPFARHLQLAAVHSIAAGVFSESFYRQFESFCDGMIDFRTQESGDHISHSMRVRVARGASHDSSWRPLELKPNGEVEAGPPRLAGSGPPSGAANGGEGDRRLAAIMFTDMVGFTALAQKNEGLAMKILEEQRKIVRPLLAKHLGREVKTIGDAFLVEFASSLSAVNCAADIQEAIRTANHDRRDEEKILIRVGIHLGDVIHQGEDVAGDAVNVASRIEPLAPPGGICVSGQVRDSVLNKAGYRFDSLGTPQLKNVTAAVEVFQIAGFGEPAVRPLPPKQVIRLQDRIAVLPLANIDQDRSEDFFTDGLTEELISSVSRTQGLRVIARTSVMKYKGTDKPISAIGRELGVGSVLEGSVRKAGDKVRITVKLVDATSEEPKWSQQYDRDMRDVFAIQSDIAKRVAEALRLQILRTPESAARPRSTEAYVANLRGRQLWNTRTEAGIRQAIGYFQKALAEDDTYARAYAGLADCYSTLALLEFIPPKEAYPKAKEAVGRALSLDSQLAEAHTSLGLIRFQYDWDWEGTEEEFTEAIGINPSYAQAHHFYADYLKAMGRFDEALVEIGKAQELDPLNLAINTGVGHVLYLSRQYDRSIDQYKKAVELDPNFTLTHIWFGRPYLEKGMYADAISELETAVKLSGEGTLALAMLGHGLASAGRKEESQSILDRLIERSKTQYVPSYWIAVVYNGYKDKVQVMKWLRRAFDERSSWLVWCNVEPRFDWLRGDPEFNALMQEMKFP